MTRYLKHVPVPLAFVTAIVFFAILAFTDHAPQQIVCEEALGLVFEETPYVNVYKCTQPDGRIVEVLFPF